MAKLARMLRSRWALSGLGVALLALLVWFFGPLLPFLAGALVRAAVILAMALVWAGANLWIDRSCRAREAALERGVTDAADGSAEEVAALRERLDESLARLRDASGRRGYLYEQPWYAIIGPPGAGKTTALLNSGLRFPLADAGAVPGVGGTRLCDWWFTEEAVLIDTAGRYTTQDSDAAVDRAGWEGFLDLLKRTRKRQPLNGVIVAMGLPDIAQSPREERMAHARAVRRRIKEITSRLALHLPVYALFTKADLLAGFSEYFDDLDRERRGQVWGTTFPAERGEAGPVARFAAEFRALVARLESRLLERLQAERSPDRRAMLAGFPAQFSSLEAPLGEFLAEAFGGSRLDPAPFLRGVYFSSGTQEGTPIDRLTGVLARTFGVDQRRAPSLRPERGRSYFLTRLLRDVVFHEAMLVSEPPGVARRRTLLRGAGYAAALLALMLGGTALWHVQNRQSDAAAQADQALDAYQAKLKDIAVDPVADGDLPRILPALDAARALPHGYDSGAPPVAWQALGLSQTGKLAIGARTVYRHALERLLLPRLIWRLEAQMRGALDRPDFLYEATRVYLMLGGQGPLDPALVREWMTLDWQSAYPGPAAAPMRADLIRHLEALLAEPLPAIPLDGGLIAAARTVFSRVPLAERVYSRIRDSAAAQNVAPWTPAQSLGPAGTPLFLRASGMPLTEGVPGFFTASGFHDVLLPALGHATQEVADESWVLGKSSEIAPGSTALQQLEHGVIAVYEQDYAKAWDGMLADLDLAPMRSLAQAAQGLYLLGSPQSPMRELLASIAQQLTLSQAATAKGGAATNAASPTGAAARLKEAFGTEPGATAPPPPPGQEIDQRYAALRAFVGQGPGAPIDGVLQLLNQVQAEVARLAATTPGTAAPPAPTGDDPALLLKAEATREPQPVARWLVGIAGTADALRSGGARTQVAAAFNGAAGPAELCRQAIAGRFPFSADGTGDVPLGDFTRLFAPGGLIDGFFNTQLHPYVDTSGRVWRARAVDGVQPPVSDAELAQFQRAAQIRDMFFGTGGNAPMVSLEIAPLGVEGAKQTVLNLGGTSITATAKGGNPAQITWPQEGAAQASLSFGADTQGGALQASGSWALFRLISQGSLQADGGSDRYRLTFQEGAAQASFELRAGSVLNPLNLAPLRTFRCPTLH